MKNLIIFVTLLSFVSCGNKLKEVYAYKNPIVDENDNQAMLAMMQTRGKYSNKTSSVVIFFWPETVDWESDYFNNDMDHQTKMTRLKEGVTYYSERHDKVDEELFIKGKQLKVWEDNECFFYSSIDEVGIPQVCVDMWNEGVGLDLRVGELQKIKPELITSIMKLLDYDISGPYNWKVLDDDGDDSKIEFGSDWRVIKKLEIIKYGPQKVNYTLENGGIRHLEIADNYRVTFYLYEKESNTGAYTGNVYKYVLDQDVRFIEKHRLYGKIHKLDSNLNLIKKDVGICKIEFNNENKESL
jgi:hypothetical protein